MAQTIRYLKRTVQRSHQYLIWLAMVTCRLLMMYDKLWREQTAFMETQSSLLSSLKQQMRLRAVTTIFILRGLRSHYRRRPHHGWGGGAEQFILTRNYWGLQLPCPPRGYGTAPRPAMGAGSSKVRRYLALWLIYASTSGPLLTYKLEGQFSTQLLCLFPQLQ